ncbi:hypothetical protein EAG_00631 [Camponotus floridanus]|uniref:Uncharacterized protein n=1 Tax=Camponotus floridanus TaxID=104421 RepID=E2ATN8_CAMFO|nr:hypothetical protein EAG_00631 [Camponotus floridanus]
MSVGKWTNQNSEIKLINNDEQKEDAAQTHTIRELTSSFWHYCTYKKSSLTMTTKNSCLIEPKCLQSYTFCWYNQTILLITSLRRHCLANYEILPEKYSSDETIVTDDEGLTDEVSLRLRRALLTLVMAMLYQTLRSQVLISNCRSTIPPDRSHRWKILLEYLENRSYQRNWYTILQLVYQILQLVYNYNWYTNYIGIPYTIGYNDYTGQQNLAKPQTQKPEYFSKDFRCAEFEFEVRISLGPKELLFLFKKHFDLSGCLFLSLRNRMFKLSSSTISQYLEND